MVTAILRRADLLDILYLQVNIRRGCL